MGLPGTKFVDTRRCKDLERQSTFAETSTTSSLLRICSSCSPHEYQGCCCTSVTPDVRPTNIAAGSSVCSAFRRRVNTCGCDSDSDPCFRTLQAPMRSLYKIFFALVTEVIFTSRRGDQYKYHVVTYLCLLPRLQVVSPARSCPTSFCDLCILPRSILVAPLSPVCSLLHLSHLSHRTHVCGLLS